MDSDDSREHQSRAAKAREILTGPRRGWTALMQAANERDAAELQRLLREGADPDAVAEGSHSALLIACARGHEEGVAALLGAGAAPDARGPGSVNALTVAVEGGHDRVITRLLDAGATLVTDRESGSALTAAIVQGRLELTQRLLQLPLRGRAIEHAFHAACERGFVEAARALRRKLPDELTLDGDIDTPLMRAAAANQPTVVDFLIDEGAPIDRFDLKDDYSPLMHAAMAGAQDAARALIRHGADVNAETEWFVTPLTIARRRGDRAMFELLVAAGAKGEGIPRGSMGTVVTPWATYGSPSPPPRPSPPPLYAAVLTGDDPAIVDALARGLDPHASYRRRNDTPFHLALTRGRGRVVRALLASHPEGAPGFDERWLWDALTQPDPWIVRLVLARYTPDKETVTKLLGYEYVHEWPQNVKVLHELAGRAARVRKGLRGLWRK